MSGSPEPPDADAQQVQLPGPQPTPEPSSTTVAVAEPTQAAPRHRARGRKGKWWPLVRENLKGPLIGTVVLGMVFVWAMLADTPWHVVAVRDGYPVGRAAVPAYIIGTTTVVLVGLLVDFPIFVMVHSVVARILGGRGSVYPLSEALTQYQVPLLADTCIYLFIVPSDLIGLGLLPLSSMRQVLSIAINVVTVVLAVWAGLLLPLFALRRTQRFSLVRCAFTDVLAFAIYSVVLVPLTKVVQFIVVMIEIFVLVLIFNPGFLHPR